MRTKILLPNVGLSRRFVLSSSWRRWISECTQCKQVEDYHNDAFFILTLGLGQIAISDTSPGLSIQALYQHVMHVLVKYPH